MAAQVLLFEDYELDRGAYELRRGPLVVRMERIPLDLLFLLTERAGDLVSREEILESIWGKNVFVDADNSINTAIRKIRLALEDALEAPRFIATVPAKGYRFIAQVRVSTAQRPARAHVLDNESRKRVMLVVLPFENLSKDPEQEYFSDGLTEEVIAKLGELASDHLGIIARTSAMAYKGTRKSMAEIGRELGVEYAIEGSVRRDNARIRISAQLIRTSDQTHVWAHQYDREFKDFLAMQSELGQAIAAQVQVKLTPGERLLRTGDRAHINQAAYDAYLHGRFHLWKVTRPNLERAIEYFHHATQIDPQLAIAYAGLADAYDVLPITSDAPPREAFPESERAAKQALKIDPGSAEAHCALASVRFWFNWDWAASEGHSRRALARNPSYARAYLRLAHMLSNTGRHEEAIAGIDAARQIDPFSSIINTLCAEFRFHARRYDEVLPLLARTFELDPNFWVAHIVLAKLLQFQGRYEEALEASQKARDFSGGNTEALALTGYTYGLMDCTSEAEQTLEKLKLLGTQKYVPQYNIATVHLGLGQMQKALESLASAYQDRDVHMVFLGVEPKWDALRNHAAFQIILRRIGLPQQM